MFNVSVAVFSRRIHLDIQADTAKREKLAILRDIMVESFLNALSKEATPSNIQTGYAASRVYPYNSQTPLESHDAIPHRVQISIA
jgi:hypothetical protein